MSNSFIIRTINEEKYKVAPRENQQEFLLTDESERQWILKKNHEREWVAIAVDQETAVQDDVIDNAFEIGDLIEREVNK